MPHTTKEKRNNPSSIVYRHGHHIPASNVITYFSMLGTSKIYTTEVHRSIFVLSIFAR